MDIWVYKSRLGVVSNIQGMPGEKVLPNLTGGSLAPLPVHWPILNSITPWTPHGTELSTKRRSMVCCGQVGPPVMHASTAGGGGHAAAQPFIGLKGKMREGDTFAFAQNQKLNSYILCN